MAEQICDENWLTEEWLGELVSVFPAAIAAEKPEWETFVLTVAGKVFGMFGGGSGETLLTVKGDPLENEALRQEFAEVIPGYHVNKKHWVSVRLAHSNLGQDHLAELIEESYTLVFASLTKKLQAQLTEEHQMGLLTRGEAE